ncbi:Nucleotide-binding universal stress protein, UspA family [Hyunsoonleella jejuensis]|uniref:Nucleotide-binding universal stress protein, UspA family n=1 Tax=Hyunsoonleella jejuensis TaxID=419940 RepID=A0A1H9B9R0_9FLAO|nr:universal stress protein [Hyunsoonleella jejuensis]SEP85742.1 Nucleotide-binding universal stress protein, UspA family [Hyunsoonleella jejuensis]
MKNILVPVGSSKNAVSHLQYAIDFAETFGAKVFVVQVYNVFTKAGTMIKVENIIERESLSFLNDLVSKVDKKGIDVIVKVLKGDLIDTLELACKAADVDLVLVEPRTNSINDEVYLGKISGKIIKQMEVPALIVPEGYTFSKPSNILMAIKSAIIKKDNVLQPLKDLKAKFNATIDLLLVKTPYHKEGDFNVNEELSSMIRNTTESVNATTFQGVLEHFQSHSPDMLCVVRRKRGFFAKKWEKDTILRKDFFIKTPVLVLSGLK